MHSEVSSFLSTTGDEMLSSWSKRFHKVGGEPGSPGARSSTLRLKGHAKPSPAFTQAAQPLHLLDVERRDTPAPNELIRDVLLASLSTKICPGVCTSACKKYEQRWRLATSELSRVNAEVATLRKHLKASEDKHREQSLAATKETGRKAVSVEGRARSLLVAACTEAQAHQFEAERRLGCVERQLEAMRIANEKSGEGAKSEVALMLALVNKAELPVTREKCLQWTNADKRAEAAEAALATVLFKLAPLEDDVEALRAELGRERAVNASVSEELHGERAALNELTLKIAQEREAWTSKLCDLERRLEAQAAMLSALHAGSSATS